MARPHARPLIGRTMNAAPVSAGLNIIINVVTERGFVRENRHLGDTRYHQRPLHLLPSLHFLTARRSARYGDQMRVDRVSSIVYTFNKPSLLTSRFFLSPTALASCLRLPPRSSVLSSRFLPRVESVEMLEKTLRAVGIFYSASSHAKRL